MSTDVFEESTLTLSAHVNKGSGGAKKVKFVFTQKGGASELADVEKEYSNDVSGGKRQVMEQVTLPRCKDDELNYTISYKVECDKQEYTGEEFVVWPRTATFKANNADDGGKPFKGVAFKFSQKPKLYFRTDDKGTCTLPVVNPEAFTLELKSPYVLKDDKWKSEVGRNREADVKKLPYIVKITSPDEATKDSDGNIRQFTNLKTKADKPERGSKLVVKVHAWDDSAKKKVEGVADEKYFVEIEFDANNSKRNDPVPALHIGGKEVKPGTNHKAKGEGKFDQKGESQFEVELGQAGLDKCTIRVGVTDKAEDHELTIVNWRKLWYQVTLPEGATAPSFTRMVGALEEVGVEYVKEGSDVVIAKTDDEAMSWLPGKWFDEAGKNFLCIGTHNKDHYHGKFVDTNTPWQVHVLGCHYQFDAGMTSCKQTVTFTIKDGDTSVWSDGSSVPGKDHWVGSGFFPKNLDGGGDSVIEVKWEADDSSKSGTLGASNIYQTRDKYHGWLGIKLPAGAKSYIAADKAKNTIKIKAKLWVAKGPYLGEADGAKGWMQLIVFKAGANVVNDVMAHELGHTMNQVDGPKPPGLGSETHGREYTGNGHLGGHCADGMNDTNYNGGAGKVGSKYEGNFSGKSECTCIMYGENGDGSSCSGKFCDRCKPFIKAEALATLH